VKTFFAAVLTIVVVASVPASTAGADGVARATGAGVSVSGSPVVGSTLTASPGSWSPEPGEREYQWLRDGEDAALSSSSTYTVAPEDIGHTLVVVEWVDFGAERHDSSFATPVVAASAAVPPAAVPPATVPPAAPAVNVSRPTIKGKATVGKRLTVKSKGTWSAAGHTYRYQWLRNGSKISGATKTSYRLTKKDRRKKISVRVSARRSGFPTVSAVSRSSARVR
jgi:hypothetical protein